MGFIKKITVAPRRVKSVAEVPGLHEYRDVQEAFGAVAALDFARLGEALSLAVIRGAGGYIEEEEVAECVEYLMTPRDMETNTLAFMLPTIARILDGSLVIRRGPKTHLRRPSFLLTAPGGN